MTTELARRETQQLTPFETIKQSVQELDQFYKSLMRKGTDYDTIPGTPKPTLLKPGAELLRLRFGFHPTFKISKGLTDIQKGFIEYDVVCTLERDGETIAEGVGNANSLESKWRYRWLWASQLPSGFDKENAFKTAGATKKTNKGPMYRIENDNPQDQANTILKIAKKRAFVDAILTATGASRIFTQDIEDMEKDGLQTTDEGKDTAPTPEATPASPPQEIQPTESNGLPFGGKYGDVLTECWVHKKSWAIDGYGQLSHHQEGMQPGNFCLFRERIKAIAQEMCGRIGIEAEGLNAAVKDKYGKQMSWSKLTPDAQVELLEVLYQQAPHQGTLPT